MLYINLTKLLAKTRSILQTWQMYSIMIMWKTRVGLRILIPKSSTSLYVPPLPPCHTLKEPCAHAPPFHTLPHSPAQNLATPYAYGCIHQYYSPPSRWQTQARGLHRPWEQAWGHLGRVFRDHRYLEHNLESKVRWSEVYTWVGHLPLPQWPDLWRWG